MVKDKLLSAVAAIGVTVLAALVLGWLSADLFEFYGLGLFVLMPFVCGALAVLVYNRRGRKGLVESLLVSLIAGCISLCGFLVVGLEGVICLAMAAPIVMPLFLLGGLGGFFLSKVLTRRRASDTAALVLLVCMPLLLAFESRRAPSPQTRSAVTSVTMSGSTESVWRGVIAFTPIPEPEAFLFRIGIAYPIDATIEGEGVGAVRYCNFSTGSFVEPITHWEPQRRLAFDVAEQPVPMTEMSPYTGLHPPHLDWAVQSERGEFLLTDLGDGRVRLTGTTWFHTRMHPEPYWSWISEQMIHAIHTRVLNHIKASVEGASG